MRPIVATMIRMSLALAVMLVLATSAYADVCPNCGGTGKMISGGWLKDCSRCGGTGSVRSGAGIPTPSVPKPPPINLPTFDELYRRAEGAATINTNLHHVRSSLGSNGFYVAWGSHIDYRQYALFSSAVASSVASSNPGPVMAYFDYMLARMKSALVQSLRGQAVQFVANFELNIVRALDRSLRAGRPEVIRFENVDLEVGIATYNHWKFISFNYPEINQGVLVAWRPYERTIPLPNTFQPYVRFRVRYQFH